MTEYEIRTVDNLSIRIQAETPEGALKYARLALPDEPEDAFAVYPAGLVGDDGTDPEE